ncbi:hypothetical protein ACGFMO_29915 [Streptomyces niveus]|uniref:hypothetical protein n=1 Tax=Streptomyces niveus TaxID=193462 RepID=UPI00372259BD
MFHQLRRHAQLTCLGVVSRTSQVAVAVVGAQVTGLTFRARPDPSLGPSEDGEVTITGHGKLYLNMSGDISHTIEFRSDGGQILSYEIPRSYRDSIHNFAIPQNKDDHPDGSAFTRQEWKAILKEYPEISDPTKGPHLYGIPDKLLDGLRDAIISGSGRVVQEG